MTKWTLIRFTNMLTCARLQIIWRKGAAAAEAADYYDLVWAAREYEQDRRNRVRRMVRAGADPKLFGEFS